MQHHQANVRMQIGPNGQIRVEGTGFPMGPMGQQPFFAAHRPPAPTAPPVRGTVLAVERDICKILNQIFLKIFF
jgi:hypothetical protein